MNKDTQIAEMIVKAEARSKLLTGNPPPNQARTYTCIGQAADVHNDTDVNTILYERLFNSPSITLTGRMRGTTLCIT